MNLNPFKTEPEPKPSGAGVFSSKAGIAANKLQIKWTADNPDTSLTEEAARDLLAKKKNLLIGGITVDEVITELKKANVIKPSVPVAKEKQMPVAKEVVVHETQFKKLDGLKTIEDDDLKKRLEENRFFDAVEKDIFKNEAELNAIYQRSLSLGKENNVEIEETDKYYYAFESLVKRGREEIDNDLESLRINQELIKKKLESLTPAEVLRVENAKKIATIAECSVEYAINTGWFGDNVNVTKTSKFDDIKFGVDEILEIKKEDSSSFMGLGIDVTFRGLLSEQYKHKFFGLLRSIRSGYKPKIKYFTNHAGEKMKQFSVPKTILYFNINDVKDFAIMIKHIDEPGGADSFKNSPQKFAVMNQMIIQCEKMAAFAEESNNDIFKKYNDVVSSIKELALKNPELQKMLDARHEDDVSLHMDYLIAEFKSLELEEEKHTTYIKNDPDRGIEDAA